MTAFDGAQRQLDDAASLDGLLFAERDAALAYWTAWKTLEIRFRASDLRRVPEHWLCFGQRVSPLTKAPRLAVNPINAVLNYLYALVEAETRIACLAAGLDPGLGIVHADTPGRASLALDLMEPIRPHVDRYVLDLVDARVFRASDFHETRKGNCGILSPLSHELAQTAPAWAVHIAPVVERVASLFARSPEARRRTAVIRPMAARPERRGQTNTTRKAELAEWEARYGKLTDLTAFEREILPLIQGVPLSRLQRATGLSLRYASLIRRGEKTPHPRHWASLASVAGRAPKR